MLVFINVDLLCKNFRFFGRIYDNFMFIYRLSATICPKNLILVMKLLFQGIYYFDLLDFEKNVLFIFRGGFRDGWDFFVGDNSIDNGSRDS